MKIYLLSTLLLVGLLACNKDKKETSAEKKAESEVATPPNIIFIFSDDHAAHAIKAYGPTDNNPELHKVLQTPNIDRLAAEGMLFRNTFCANSICGPSRATILTGKHSHLNGFLNNDTVFNGGQQTFSKILQKSGYETAWIGKWHLGTKPTGFDFWEILNDQGTYYNPKIISGNDTTQITGYTSTVVTDNAIAWLDEKRDKSKPFFLTYAHKTPHREWVPKPEDKEAFKNVKIPLPSNFYDDYANRSSATKDQEMEIANHMNEKDLKFMVPKYLNEEQAAIFKETYREENEAFAKSKLKGKKLAEWKYQRYMSDYLGSIASMDRDIGRFLDYLDSAGLSENTIVIYSSDQGFYLGEHGWFDKRWMYEESLRMPFIVRWPGVIEGGSENTDLTQNIDFAETFLELAGASIPEDMQGRSLVSLFKGKTPKDWRKNIYYHYWAYPDWHMVRQHVGIRSDRYKLIHYNKINEWELFDLKEDPSEMKSVYNDAAYAKIQEEMTSALSAMKIEVGDTLSLKSSSVYHSNSIKK